MADRFSARYMKPLEGVPLSEGAEKKQKRDAALIEARKKALKVMREKRAAARHDLKLRTYKYVKEYRLQREELIKNKREARANGGFYRAPEAKVVFCIRIKGINKLAPKPKMILRLFRLRQLHNGVFIRVNKATMEMLQAVQPFVTYGYPSLSTVRKLIYKRGYAKVGEPGSKQRVRLQENSIIEKHLGKYGIHGIEDLVHEIYTCGPAFKQANAFLWTFKLNSPRKGFKCKRHGFCEPRAGDWGNRQELINELVNRMC
ncbi:60S ribosomal protein L7, putative [Eimeria mitis]|uniref:60S ribosomal protein L7, putative n=1 Tax=Eimeria mitis TaxID=44415 RepID=U6JPM8_9EIME|nr:60S ribosomal protein L7, putative [Eimeria mitis]CDJ27460.1 60S ribosomal protein L7, putative [Eimeria mitis]